ncbi:MAG: metallopeptidase TldD-related protein [Bacteroidota bacterium]|nr:metallopeptidase TldD-related protein [Bacteroidota bacterium]
MKTPFLIRALTVLSLCFGIVIPALSQDKLLTILEEELQREMQSLKKQEIPVYYLSYRAEQSASQYITTSLGALVNSAQAKNIQLTVTLRVGSPELDNYHPMRDMYDNTGYSLTVLPLPDEPVAVKQAIWNATNDAYQQAVTKLTKVKANIAIKVEEEDKAADFWLGPPNVYVEPPLKQQDFTFDKALWEKRMKKYSSVFLRDSDIFNGISYIVYRTSRDYFISTNGDKVVQNRTSANIAVTGTIKAKDGMEMPLVETFMAFKPEKLPSDDDILKQINSLVDNLVKLKNAPVAEPYTGPALLSGKAAGVFFHEIFGHRVEGTRMKNESDAQTFKKKLNEQVLPENLSVYSDPQQKEFNKQDLNGYYLYDNEGVKGQKVTVVKDGVLKDFLMSRTPIAGFPKSNGHGRAQIGNQPIARQSNLIVDARQPETQEQLRAELIRLAKEQNKPYGYLFDEVVGGFTNTGRYSPNAFNVTPTLVYRVYADGRPDEVVRGVDLIGTPLSMFSQIDKAGGSTEIFNGICGAESGGVPVSCISPMLLVKMVETQKKAKSQDKSFILPRPDLETK